ncbi:unnamed protein product [Callosobruchus maculatus]|uniref:BHLH domain-containing protein n=1 Tax=Callosobruchus maculatus TaxID=64391 RepID=A0A653CJF6_CALMS|nr:unnamed protein product [Callosobruchus maculatus]
MPRSSKCREWEKERRNRVNEAFVSLAKVLPNYDPSVNLPKIDILLKAKTAIVELQAQVASIVSPEEKETAKTNEFKRFQNRIRVLLNRNELLVNLLKDAKVSVPKHLEPIKVKNKYPWVGKIKPEQAEVFQKKEMEKENISQSSQMSRRIRNSRKSCKTKAQTCRKNSIINKTVGPKCVVVLPQSKYLSRAMRQGTTTLSNVLSKTYVKPVGATSNSKPICISGNALSSLGPGTLIFPNGTALPVVTQSPFCLSPTVTLLTNPIPTVQLTAPKPVQNAPQFVLKQTATKKYTRPIKPNICLTTTTQVNKVPIPALSTNYTNTVLLKCAQKKATSKSLTPERNEKCLKRKAGVTSSTVSKKAKSNTNENETVASVSTAISTSSNVISDLEKPDTTNVSKTDICNVDGKKSDEKIISDDVGEIAEKLSDKQDNAEASEPKTNELIDNVETNYIEMVEHQPVIDRKEKSCDLPTTSDTKTLDTVTSNESSEKKDTPNTIGSAKPVTTCTKDTPPCVISHETKTNHSHSELSNDIFGSLTVGPSCQNPESTSPTAAFLMSFPLVSSVKATDEENVDGHDTENLLQTNNTDTNKIALPDSLLNLDSFSFLSCSNFLNKCSTALGNENMGSNMAYTSVKSPILQADFSESVSRGQQEINKKSDSSGSKSVYPQIHIPKETSTIEKLTAHNEAKNENFDFPNQSVATREDKEISYNPFDPKVKDKHRNKLVTYQEPLQNSSHIDMKCVEQTDNKNKEHLNIDSLSKASSNKTDLTSNLQKQNIVGSKDLDSYYHDLSSLNVNNEGDNNLTADKNIRSVKCNVNTAGKNAINFDLPFVAQNSFDQNNKDCYNHTDPRIKSGSSEIPQSTAMNVLSNIGVYSHNNNSWNSPKVDNKLSVDKNSVTYQSATKPTYSLNHSTGSDSKNTVSQGHIHSNSNKPDSKQNNTQNHLQTSSKALYDFDLSESMSYNDRNKPNTVFCADKNTGSVSHQSVPNSTKYSINASEPSGSKNAVASSRQGLQNAKKATYGFDISDPTTYMYPNSTYNSKPSAGYRPADFGMHPTNIPLGFGSNHFDKITSSLCGVKGITATETFALNTCGDTKKFPESVDNVHCANIFEDRNVASKVSGMRSNALQYPLKSNEFGPNQLYTNYQHATSDNSSRMANVIYPERLSNTVNNRLPNSNIHQVYDRKQNSQVYGKDDKEIGTLNQGMKHKNGDFSNSREKLGETKNNADDRTKKSDSALQQHESCYKEKAKSVRNMNKVGTDLFSAQGTMGVVHQSNKDGNQISQLYMANLPSASCSYQTEDTKTCSYSNYSRYNYVPDVSSNQHHYKPVTSTSFGQEGGANFDATKYCGNPVKKSNPFNPPVNWMTTADTKTDSFLPQLSTASYTFASTDQAKQYTWSTTKFSNIFEPSQTFVPHSMPSLPFLTESKPKEKRSLQQENQSNFLSVSQLVDHGKNESTSAPARVSARRNSGNRSKGANPSKNKRTTKTDTVEAKGAIIPTEYCYEQKQTNRNRNSMSYSAEALIGNQGNEFSNKKLAPTESKSLVTTNFLADSMVTYFPSVDDNYMPHNNFSANNFSHNSFQSTSYSANNFLYSAPPNAFEAPPDFLSDNIAEMKHKKSTNKEEKTSNCAAKKSRKKQTNDGNGFEASFPPTNETSILSEDFPHGTFLAPTTPYPCKTNLYQKQTNEFNTNCLLPLPGLARSVGQAVEATPSLNTAGTSLTNFNLSTIFPEINKVSFNSENKYNFGS